MNVQVKTEAHVFVFGVEAGLRVSQRSPTNEEKNWCSSTSREGFATSMGELTSIRWSSSSSLMQMAVAEGEAVQKEWRS